MKRIYELNFTKSINKKRLIYKESYYDKFDTFTHLFIAIVMCYSVYRMFVNQGNLNENERFFIYLYFIASLAVCFITFKKLTEKRLKTFETRNSEEENKQLLIKLSKDKGWAEFRNTSNILIFYDDAGDWTKYTKIFLLKNNRIYYTVLTERFKLDYPTLTQNYSVKKLLESLK